MHNQNRLTGTAPTEAWTVEVMQESQADATESHYAVDSEIAGILRGIAKTLSDQVEAESEAEASATETAPVNCGDGVQRSC